MDRGDITFGVVIALGVAGSIGAIAAIVYVVITVAKFAWDG